MMGWAIIECPCCGARMELGKHISMQTNADRFRSMSDEELAFYIVNHPKWSDESACLSWLKECAE